MQLSQSTCRTKPKQQTVNPSWFDQQRHVRPSALSIFPIIDATGVKHRNFSHADRQAPATTERDLRDLVLTLFSTDHDDKTAIYDPFLVDILSSTSTSDEVCLADNPISSAYLKSRSLAFEQHSFQLYTTPHTIRSAPFNITSLPQKSKPLNNVSKSRSLTGSFDGPLPVMTSVVAGPGSPPELSESQSSKSSSYGSNFSSPEGLCSGITNFEDIGLDDDHESPICRNERNDSARVGSVSRKNDSTISKHHPKRPSLSGLQTEIKPNLRSTENGVKSAHVTAAKRGFTSPVVPSVDRVSRTRSASPPTRIYPSRSVSSGKHYSNPSLDVPLRRGSWQPARKTIQEIEAEYHESDDELPNDASLFNVPVSPFPAGPSSGRSSARGSPERYPVTRSPRPIPLSHTQTMPEIPQRRKMSSSQPLPRHRLTPRSSTSSLSKSNPTSPHTGSLRNGRSKSWNLAMSDLNFEARIISENLAYHSEAMLEQTGSPTEALPPARNSAPGAIPLPPIQTGTLDFMPISKEKEAILSRTRPSWLPPKDPKEEKRHLKQYQEMMKAAIEADKKRDEKLKEQEAAKEQTHMSLNRIWTYYIEPTTDIINIDPRVHELCWRGITPRLRGRVWQRRMGNPLGLNKTSYDKALQRAQEVKSTPTEKLTDHEKSMIVWFSDIERDAETAFPEFKLFQRNCPHWKDVIDICEAYTTYRSDVGYVYGLQLMTAVLLLQLSDPSEVFALLANCLNQPLPMAFQTGDVTAVHRTYGKVKSALEMNFPRLHDYLFASREEGGLGFSGSELFQPMFQTLFANGLDADRLSRVWDIWIFEGDCILIRTAVALLGSLRSQIFDLQGDIDLKRRNIQEMLAWGPFLRSDGGYWHLETTGNDDAFVEEIRIASR